MSPSHPSELRITVVEDLDWPAFQQSSAMILTPNALWPQDVTLDDALSVSRLTPNSLSGKFLWAETPSTSHTFGFPLSARSASSKFPPEGAGSQSPLEKQKRRLKRYHAAETSLARLPAHPTPSPRQLRIDAVRYAACQVSAHVTDARQCLRAIFVSGRRDNTRWLAEHRLAALEALEAELASSPAAQPRDGDEDSVRRREANLVRFLGVRRDEGLVPVFTRTRGRHRLAPRSLAETERRCMTVGSPMKLQSGGMPLAPTSRHEWPWETRVRSALLYPAPKPNPHESLRIRTETPPLSSSTLSTRTSSSFSSREPETPLTELEDEAEDYLERPKSKTDSTHPLFHGSIWQSHRTSVSSSRLPPLRASASVPTRRLQSPEDDEDEDDEDDDDGYQDNYGVYPVFKRNSTRSTPHRAPAPAPTSRLPPVPVRRETPPPSPPEEDEDDDDGYADNYEDYPTFPANSALSYTPPQGPRLPSLRTAKVDLKPDASYAWLADSATWASPPAWHGDGWEVSPASASTSNAGSANSSTSSSSTASPTSAITPRTPISRAQMLPHPPSAVQAPAPAHRFWGRARRPSLLPIVEAAMYAAKPLPPPPPSPPHSPKKEKEKGRHFFSGLINRPTEQVRGPRDSVNKLRTRGSVASLRSVSSWRD